MAGPDSHPAAPFAILGLRHQPGSESVPDISAIASALGALKGMKDIAEAMIGLRDAKILQEKRLEFQARIIDAQNGILAAQEERATLLKRVGDLEKQVTDFEAWETEKQRYELRQLARGGAAFAYTPKADTQGAEPFHCICATCYQRGTKSILQFSHIVIAGSAEHILKCPVCQTEVHAERWPPPKIV
jgi:hypothetical protein